MNSPSISGGNVTTEALTAGKTVLATFYLCLSLYVMVMNLVELVIIVRIKTTSSTIYIARFRSNL